MCASFEFSLTTPNKSQKAAHDVLVNFVSTSSTPCSMLVVSFLDVVSLPLAAPQGAATNMVYHIAIITSRIDPLHICVWSLQFNLADSSHVFAISSFKIPSTMTTTTTTMMKMRAQKGWEKRMVKVKSEKLCHNAHTPDPTQHHEMHIQSIKTIHFWLVEQLPCNEARIIPEMEEQVEKNLVKRRKKSHLNWVGQFNQWTKEIERKKKREKERKMIICGYDIIAGKRYSQCSGVRPQRCTFWLLFSKKNFRTKLFSSFFC